jgi:hypothetical protein
MARLDEEVVLAHDIAALRELIDRLLDQGRQPEDVVLVAASLVLNEKLAELDRQERAR